MKNCEQCNRTGNERYFCRERDCLYTLYKKMPPKQASSDKVRDISLKKAKESKLPEIEIKQNNMKKLLGALKRTLSGENKTGQLVHGLLDLFPIPNQAIAKGVKALFEGDNKTAKAELGKMLTVRNGAALLGSVAYFAGWITLDDLKSFVDFILSIASS